MMLSYILIFTFLTIPLLYAQIDSSIATGYPDELKELMLRPELETVTYFHSYISKFVLLYSNRSSDSSMFFDPIFEAEIKFTNSDSMNPFAVFLNHHVIGNYRHENNAEEIGFDCTKNNVKLYLRLGSFKVSSIRFKRRDQETMFAGTYLLIKPGESIDLTITFKTGSKLYFRGAFPIKEVLEYIEKPVIIVDHCWSDEKYMARIAKNFRVIDGFTIQLCDLCFVETKCIDCN